MPTALSRKLSTSPAVSRLSPKLSHSLPKKRSLRSSSSHRRTKDTYRRWKGVRSGLRSVNCIAESFPRSARQSWAASSFTIREMYSMCSERNQRDMMVLDVRG